MNDMNLYIIAGANGSGKSTLASELLPDKNLKLLHPVTSSRTDC